MLAIRTLAGWADVAQYVLAIAAVLALVGAFAQVRAIRRRRVYEYADSLNTLEMLRATAEHARQWPKWTAKDFESLTDVKQLEWMRLPNLVEEIAFLYNRAVIDRGVAAELLGVYVERLWQASERLVKDLRTAEQRPRIFIHWEHMQTDTWRRRGAGAPLGRIPAASPPRVSARGTPLRLRWMLSAAYRRECRRFGYHL